LAKRVFELARELGVTSKVVLAKCRAEELDIKNHMSALTAGQEATIREWFSDAQSGTAVEVTEPVDLERVRKEVKKRRQRKKGAEEEVPVEPSVVKETKAPEAQPQIEQAPEPALEESRPGRETEETVQAPAEHLAKAPSEAAARQEEPKAPPPKPEKIKPAGPQVVPRPAKLKGPRVVRVERPDLVRPPSRRKSTGADVPARSGIKQPQRQRGFVGGSEADEQRPKRGKRRSPRRRGRTAESGERLKEWRDQDLMERSQRLAAATSGLRRHRATVAKKPGEVRRPTKAGPVEIQEPITIKSLSAATGIKAAELIRKLMAQGTLATVNQVIDRETAQMLMLEFDIELRVGHTKTAEEELIELFENRPGGKEVPRAPVVTFLGHVDHGKTSLLDRIRNTQVVEGEAGGITQHMGAYRYDMGEHHIVFLDTPGHEAFTAMRARGANMTDLVVLVVAADDGVMPQTVEAINHAKAAGVPILVALNKIDVPNANVTRAIGQLVEHGLQPREWGGQTEVIQTSAVTGEGIDTLLETLSLEAQLLELKARQDAPASGYVIEAHMDPGLGSVATLLIRDGVARLGDVLLAGVAFGRIRQMTDDKGRPLEQAGPSTPVEVAGLDGIPEAGEKFFVLEDLDQARSIAEDRRQAARLQSLQPVRRASLSNLLDQIAAGETNELALIIKADTQGSVEAITSSLEKLGNEEVGVRILHAAVGGISTGDVTLAEASDALIVGFNVVGDAAARQLAEQKGVEVRLYRVIYDLIEDIRKALSEGLAPEIREETLGHAEVRQVFKVSRIGTVAGCYVTDGAVNRNASVRIIRDSVVIEDERKLESLRRFQDDVREVRAGMECGIKVAGYDDIKEGDTLEFYQRVEVARTL